MPRSSIGPHSEWTRLERSARDESQKRFLRGSHRTVHPRETLDRIVDMLSDFGITRVADLTGLDNIGIPVFSAIRPSSRSLVVSMGKGIEPESAMASALMESIECWHAEHIDAPLRTDTYLSICEEGEAVVNLGKLPQVGVGRPDVRLPRSWIQGWDLIQDVATWVPLDVVSLDFIEYPDVECQLLRTSNGLASGNHPLEAVLHALCEVIERDAEALWRASANFRRIDAGTVHNPDCVCLLEKITSAGLVVGIWDVTSEIGVPAYGCAVAPDPTERTWRAVGVHDGFGCHPYPEVALSRALTEAVQTRLTYISGARDDLMRRDLEKATNVDLVRGVWAELDQIPCTEIFNEAGLESKTVYEDVQIVLSRLKQAGFDQAVAVDLSRTCYGVSVVKVIVPGLEGPVGESHPGARVAGLVGVGC